MGRRTVSLRVLCAALAAFAATIACASMPPPDFAGVRAAHRASDAVLLDRRGTPLQSLRIDVRTRSLGWIALPDVSPSIAAALVAGEDRHFFEHHGVDWSGLAAAAVDSALRASQGASARGGSTLSMQLAAMLDPALGTGGHRSLAQKWGQAEAALALEQRWSKQQILEAYLNLATFRGESIGIGAAARTLFGKDASGIDADEAAILVALLRAPAAPADTVARRACAIIRDLDGAGNCERSRQLAQTRLTGGNRLAAQTGDAPQVARRLLRTAGTRVRSTLDADVQRAVIASLDEHLAELAGRSVADGAVVVLDNATGDVLAYVGNTGAAASAREVDGAAALRQPGSALKPFLYALALDRRLLTAASLIDDRPIAIATARGMYMPQNYDYEYRGMVSARTALASSLNVPAVRTLELAGGDALLDTLHAFGLDTLKQDADYYGAALALGSGEVSLLALTNAYRALANGGVHSPVRFAPDAPPQAARRVIGAGAAFIVTDILADRAARATAFGLDNALATRVWSAAKTGTSKDMRDNWCVGYTDRYTVGVWVGNFNGEPMHDVSGVSGAAPVWRDVIHFLHRASPSLAPKPPADVVARSVTFEPAVEASRRDYFLRGTEMSTVHALGVEASLSPTIRYPANDTIVALDPDIPPGHQRITFEASAYDAGLAWHLDNHAIAMADARASWAPTPGHHMLALVDASGRALSTIRFEVRGGEARRLR
ncbi:MAG: penicillin-binding protein 1C [Casimicrobiaceae bacterium]